MNKKLPYIMGGAVLLLVTAFLISNQNNKQPQNTVNVGNITPSSNPATQTASQNPQDIVPGLYKNEIQNSATQDGFTVANITVENNTDQTGKTVGDHLQFALKNTSGKDLTDFEVYYTISDKTTNKKEGYYKKLTGFVLKSGQTGTINFDNKQGDGHFSANKNSIYYTSSNALIFDVSVSSLGYKIQTVQIAKSAGGAEAKD